MRILIDERLNWRISRALTGHYAVSAQKMGWAGLKNSALLVEAEKQFDVFITGDLNLNFQQDVTKHNIAVTAVLASAVEPLQEDEILCEWSMTGQRLGNANSPPGALIGRMAQVLGLSRRTVRKCLEPAHSRRGSSAAAPGGGTRTGNGLHRLKDMNGRVVIQLLLELLSRRSPAISVNYRRDLSTRRVQRRAHRRPPTL